MAGKKMVQTDGDAGKYRNGPGMYRKNIRALVREDGGVRQLSPRTTFFPGF